MSKCTIIIPLSLTSVFAQDMRASALDCTAVSQIFEQSLTARGKHSPSQTWLRRWKTDSWIRPLFSQTLQLSHGQNSLKSWLEEFSRSGGLVSQSAPLENAKQPKMNGGSSTSLQMELPLCDRESYSLKTSKDSFQPRCQTALPFLATASRDWKAYITELRQAYSARLNAERLTNASGCSSWPSPVASEVRQGFQDRSRGMKGSQESLTTVVIKQHGPAVLASSNTHGNRPESWATKDGNWTTPVATDTGRTTQYQQGGKALSMQAVQQWQTATVSTGAHRQKDGSMTDKLDRQVKQWPAPEASQGGRQGGSFSQNSWKKEDGTPKQPSLAQATIMDQQVKSWATPRAEMDSGAHNGRPDTLHSQMKVQAVGKLNPRWVETLMGLPVGWTMPSCASPVTIERMSSDFSETESFQPPQSGPSGC